MPDSERAVTTYISRNEAMPTEVQKRTAREEFMQLPEGAPYQLIGGKLVKESSPTRWHQRSQTRLGVELVNFVTSRSLGEVYFAPFDIHLAEEEIYQPDILFVSNERLLIIRDRFVEGAPDLVVEILSPSTGRYDLWHKRDVYERSGVKEYWILDPMEGSIEVLALIDGVFEPVDRATTSGTVTSRLLPGFRVDVSAIFS